MSLNFCCVAWADLGKELALQKEESLNKLIKRGIPRSTFSPIYRILEDITNFCPLCGSDLKKDSKQKETKATETKQDPVFISNTPVTIKCPPCKGSGTISGVNCLTCLGTGLLDKSNPMRGRFDPEFSKEQSEKLEFLTSKIVEKEVEIRANPKPLREDAKPENWGKF